MRPAKRTNQGGSVLVYTVVAIVLGLLVVGAVYTVNKLGHTDGEISEVAVNTEENDATDESTTSTSDEKEADNKSDKSSESTKSEDSNTKESEDSSTSSTTGQTDSKESDSSSQQKSDDSSKKQKVDELPQTGPADVIYSLVALSAIGFATASYVQSRRSLI